MINVVLSLLLFLSCSVVSAQDSVLSEYKTKFAWRGEHVNRARNISIASKKINNYTVNPGEVFSFNDVVGPRTFSAGFKKAHVIISGDMVDGIGGGVCQVSSTLHAAVLYAGLEIIEERPHSRASLYIQPSLDSTVAWPTFDFKWKNNTEHPITISSIAEKGYLTVKLFSTGNRDVDVSIVFNVLKKRQHKTVKIMLQDKPKSWKKVIQPGTFGYDIERVRTISQKTGRVAIETVKYHYEPSERIVEIGTKE